MKNIKLTSSCIVLIITLFSFFACQEKSKKEIIEISKSNNEQDTPSDFKISLAQWSLHQSFFGGVIEDWVGFARTLKSSPDDLLKGDIKPIDFPAISAGYGIYSIELVNTFYYGKVDNQTYWNQFKKNCEEANVEVGLIMCDLLGNLADTDEKIRDKAVENHKKWVDIAQFLGAHSIRVNTRGQGTSNELARNAVDGLSKLGKYGATKGINIIVENHGGYSSDGVWLAEIMNEVGMSNVGTLPDFGNFCVVEKGGHCVEEYDRYKGVAELMPYAKGVSAKSNVFDENGDEINTDYLKMMKIVKESGFKGYVGIEYEGGQIDEYGTSQLSEEEGIKATKVLLEKVFKKL